MRLKELNASPAIPSSFRLYATLTIENPQDVEQHVHRLFSIIEPSLNSLKRLKKGKKGIREFFYMSPEKAYIIFQEIAGILGIEDCLTLYDINERAKYHE